MTEGRAPSPPFAASRAGLPADPERFLSRFDSVRLPFSDEKRPSTVLVQICQREADGSGRVLTGLDKNVWGYPSQFGSSAAFGVRGHLWNGGMQPHLHDLYRAAERQRGLVTRSDLRVIGITRTQRATLLRARTLVPLGRQTFLLGGSPPDPLRHLMLACLDTGGALSHRSGVAAHGVPGVIAPSKPEVLVGRLRTPDESALATVHSTTWLPADDLTIVEGIPCTSIARCLFNLAGLIPEVPAEVVRGAVDDAIRLGKASDAWLWWRLEKLRCRGRSGVAHLEAILLKRAGGQVTESWLEREFLRIVEAAGVPVPVCQRRIRAQGAFVARVDFLYEALGIVVEVTGAQGHSSREQRAADAKRRNRLGMQGFLVLEFTYEQVVASPEEVIAELWSAIASRSTGRRPA